MFINSNIVQEYYKWLQVNVYMSYLYQREFKSEKCSTTYKIAI